MTTTNRREANRRLSEAMLSWSDYAGMEPRREANRRLSEAMLSWSDYAGMEPRPEGTYAHHVFRDHNCGGCDNGAKPCREGNYNSCSCPRARND